MKVNVKLFISFLFYGLGILAFLITDLYVVTNFPIEFAANWAYYKSLLFITGSLGLLGLDQVLVRNPHLVSSLLKTFSVQITLIALALVIAISIINPTTNNQYILFLNIILFSSILFFSAIFRSRNQLIRAQFTTNAWKCLLLFFLYFSFTNQIDLWYLSALSLILIVALVMYFSTSIEHVPVNSQLPVDNARNIGLLFLFHNLTLILSVYGEQFLINFFGQSNVSHILYAHFIVFTPIALSINGFLGFYLGPKIRRVKTFSLVDYQKLNSNIIKYSLGITIISIVIGFVAFNYFYKNNNIQMNFSIILALFLLCLSRGIYTTSSVCLGIFADNKILSITAKLNWLILIIYIGTLVIILNVFKDVEAAEYIAYTSSFHWLCRLGIARHYTRRVVFNINKKIIT
ncbi:MAG: hypothetical protein MJK12_08575 [Colwellia sp.]|nr:hypothetical protein [Colwellia sp.]